jgi:hypothetical protein
LSAKRKQKKSPEPEKRYELYIYRQRPCAANDQGD